MKRGIYLSILTALISGISVFSNAVIVSKTDPLIFALIRNGIVAILLTVLLYVTGGIQHMGRMKLGHWGKLFIIGAIGGGIPFALFFTGLADIGAINGNIIQKTLFLWVALLAVPILRERVTKIQWIGYLTLFLGMFVFGGTFRVIPKAGTYLILLATILWAVEQIIAKKTLQTVSPLIVSWGRMVFGLPFLLVASFVVGKSEFLANPTSYNIFPIMISGAFLTAYMTTWYSALSKAPSTLVSSVLVFAPVVTAICSFFFFHKPFARGQEISYLFLMIGVVCMVVETLLPKRQEHIV